MDDGCALKPGTHLPRRLRALGVATFGSVQKLEGVLDATAPPQMFRLQPLTASAGTVICIHLLQLAGDNSIGRLGQDVLGTSDDGPYGLRRVRETSGVIWDVGANLGAVSIAAARLHPTLQIVGLEPTPTTYFFYRWNLHLNGIRELTEAQLGSNGPPGVLPLQRALTSNGRNVTIRYNPLSSQDALTGAEQKTAHWQAVTVRSVAMRTFMLEHGLAVAPLVKLDCEGCEFEVLTHGRAFFGSRQKVLRLGAELHFQHWSIGTIASKKQLNHSRAVLRARGCRWHSYSLC